MREAQDSHAQESTKRQARRFRLLYVPIQYLY